MLLSPVVRSMFLALLSAVAARSILAQGTATIVMTSEVVAAGPAVNEPIFVRISFYNRSSEVVLLDATSRSDGFGLLAGQVLRPDGRKEEGPKLGVSEHRSIKRISVPAAESASVLLLANTWSDFDLAGHYLLRAALTKPPKTEDGVELPLPAALEFVIEVGPRDSQRLERICANLEQETLNQSGYASAVAADTLAYVKDDVAVPYLFRLLQRRDKLAPTLSLGLQRIATPRAVEALLPFVNDLSEDRRVSVRSALARIAAGTKDVSTRQRIADALR